MSILVPDVAAITGRRWPCLEIGGMLSFKERNPSAFLEHEVTKRGASRLSLNFHAPLGRKDSALLLDPICGPLAREFHHQPEAHARTFHPPHSHECAYHEAAESSPPFPQKRGGTTATEAAKPDHELRGRNVRNARYGISISAISFFARLMFASICFF